MAPQAAIVVAPDSAPVEASARAAVTRLSLGDFRNYTRLRLDVYAAPVVLTGPNGSGKTNLLEAVSFLAPGRGLRRARLSELDRRPTDVAMSLPWTVHASLHTPFGPVEIGTGRDAGDGAVKSERRTVRINGASTRGHKELARHLALVWLTPDMDRLFMDGASARRRFLDRLVYGFHPEHAGEVAAYETTQRERARLLADGGDPSWLDALEDGMARHGIAIAAARWQAVRRLDRAASQGVGLFPAARLDLAGEVDSWLTEMPAVAAEDRLRAALGASRASDAATGMTACGPHRSDLTVHFAIKDRPARECSTGEQKALLLSILLGMARELAAERGAAPILLFDEVVAHLDGARRAALFDEISALGAQAWLTGTDDELFQGLRGRARFFRVLDATVTAR